MRDSQRRSILILDGGMGRELERIGAPFRQPEWSALALIESPDHVLRAHLNFIEAGADVITTNSYAIVPFHIGWERFQRDGLALATLAGKLAHEAASRSASKTGVMVAGSLPPLFGSYRPDLFDPLRAPEILAPLIEGLSPSVDLWLAETQSSIAEAMAARAGTADDPRPFWLSFTLEDEAADAVIRPRLRSGELVGAAARAAHAMGASALLFNCSQPEIMRGALGAAGQELARLGDRIPLGVYANAFAPQPKDARANEDVSGLRSDLDPSAYCRFADDWIAAGAGIIGGCCGIGPRHIAAIRDRVAGIQQ
jgi:S-methylmethionine-dependent homocysteine/selenocysteine methylase